MGCSRILVSYSDPEYSTSQFLGRVLLSSLSGSLLSLAAQVPAGFVHSQGEVLPVLATVDTGLEGLSGVEGVPGLLLPAPPAPVGGALGGRGASRGSRGTTRPPYGTTLEPGASPAPTSPSV